jgi:hypothetical protein
MVFVIYNLDRPLFYYEFSKLKVKFFDGKLTSTMFSWQPSAVPLLFNLVVCSCIETQTDFIRVDYFLCPQIDIVRSINLILFLN